MGKLISLCFALGVSLSAQAAVVDFHIASGVGDQAWNTQATPIHAAVGDVIRFHNDDAVNHRLHTYGAPCKHGPKIAPGDSWDCVASLPYSSAASGPLYDHIAGQAAEVWLEVAPVARAAKLPDCVHMGDTQNTFNNGKILELKRHSPEYTQEVALLRGTFTKVYSHDGEFIRFQLKIGPRASDTVEILYYSIEALPHLRPGDQVIACGVYQTKREDWAGTPHSPDGALIYDTNFAWKPTADDGFLVINGVLYAR